MGIVNNVDKTIIAQYVSGENSDLGALFAFLQAELASGEEKPSDDEM